jgi:hypothetical protein
VEAQEASSEPRKALDSEVSCRVLTALIAKFFPTVRGFLNFLKRHVT